MKKIVLAIMIGMMMFSCAKKQANPFLGEYGTPFETPPFDKIKIEHYMPAFEEGIRQEKADIDAIVNNPDEPTFGNTIEALEQAGELLTRVNHTFGNLNDANTSDEMQAIAQQVAPLLSKQSDDILLNVQLFGRIKSIWLKKDELGLDPEQLKVLDEYYKDFVRGGADLNDEDKAELRAINEKLAVLTLKFGENVLKETNNFELVIDNEEDLSGLTESVIASGAEAAKEQGYEDKWVYTLDKPSLIPFIQYSDRRELREKLFKAYIQRGDNNNEFDNKDNLKEIAALRVRRANLLGYATHADFMLEPRMARNPQNVYDFLNKLWTPALVKAKGEAKALQAMIDREGQDFKLQPWDWWYYSEKLRKERYDLDDEALRPYFNLENVLQGAFTLANKLYGITFEERHDIPVYHEDVRVWEVKEADGSHIGILYTDYFPRASKRGGAWMDVFRKQSAIGGKKITPIAYNVGNFSKPTDDTPSLLNWDEVTTLFHEFGHALHGLLSDCTYPKLSGTSVAWDFVELPSQFMENFAGEPEMLKMYALHYQTGEPIPDELIEKLKNSSLFNKGFETVEFLAACYLDMDWHTLKTTEEQDAIQFEDQSMAAIGLIPEIIVRYRSPYFRHIFAGGYSAGYYSYIWAEVLDSDAFQAFKETSLFDRETANRFRKYILSAGGTDDPMEMYKRFRGREPEIGPLLQKRGLN